MLRATQRLNNGASYFRESYHRPQSQAMGIPQTLLNTTHTLGFQDFKLNPVLSVSE